MSPANLVFFGSPGFSATILDSLMANPAVKVVGVVTSPDKPVGRKQILTPSPVAVAAAKHDLPIFKPTQLDIANLAHLKLLKPDIFLVVSYGKIIPPTYLTTPTLGTFNIHFSLLPKYRGALPISEAIRNGDTQTGVTLMVMDDKLDHGPLISQEVVAIDINDNNETLTNKLTQTAGKLLASQLPLLINRECSPQPQVETEVTYTPSHKTRTRSTAYLPWPKLKSALTGTNALAVHNFIRSNNPEPGAWTTVNNSELKIIQTTYFQNQLLINLVQLPGKPVISWASFQSGHPLN